MEKVKYKAVWTILIGLIILLSLILSFPAIRSRVVMKTLSLYEYRQSVFYEEGLKITIPGGKSTKEEDWYPFVMTHNGDPGFSRFIGEEVRLTILYNFGNFPLFERRSSVYDPESSYYTSFYGVYGVRRVSGEPFGFLGKELYLDELVQVLEYDLTRLVLVDLGKKNPHFDIAVINTEKVRLFDEEGWYKVDGIIETNGVYHQYQEKRQNYIQYGKPPKNLTESKTENFPLIELKGRMYVKYDLSNNITLGFYCLSPDMQVIEAWDENFLKETVFTEKI